MQTCEYAGDPFTEPRSHPWLESASDPNAHYYDLTAAPALIRRALEDFRPWEKYAAVESFYRLLERINDPRSLLESNDCAFSSPQATERPAAPKALECSGRLTILFRALQRNTRAGQVERLSLRLHEELAQLDPAFRLGMVGTTLVPARYLALPEAEEQQLGRQLLISFWAWGDTEADTMRNLERVMNSLSRALRSLSRS